MHTCLHTCLHTCTHDITSHHTVSHISHPTTLHYIALLTVYVAYMRAYLPTAVQMCVRTHMHTDLVCRMHTNPKWQRTYELCCMLYWCVFLSAILPQQKLLMPKRRLCAVACNLCAMLAANDDHVLKWTHAQEPKPPAQPAAPPKIYHLPPSGAARGSLL